MLVTQGLALVEDIDGTENQKDNGVKSASLKGSKGIGTSQKHKWK